MLFILSQVYSGSDAKKANSNLTQIIEEKLKGLHLPDKKSQESHKSGSINEKEIDAEIDEENAKNPYLNDEISKQIDFINKMSKISENSLKISDIVKKFKETDSPSKKVERQIYTGRYKRSSLKLVVYLAVAFFCIICGICSWMVEKCSNQNI